MIATATSQVTLRGTFRNGRKHLPSGAFLFPKLMQVVVLVALLVLMQSCYVTKTVYTENIFNTWLGRSAHDLMLQRGTPSAITPNGMAGQVYTYDESTVVTTGVSAPGYLYSRSVGIATPASREQEIYYQPGATVSSQFVSQKKVEYFIDSKGIIYAWRAVGYPHTFTQRYSKQQLASGQVDTTLFIPPTTPR